MVISGVEDNWSRVEIMYSIVNEYYILTKGTDFRERRLSNGNMFPYSLEGAKNMKKESILVGSLMVWSVITLESLINHAFAEKDESSDFIKKAINNTNKLLKEKDITHSYNSKLSAKLVLLKGESSNEVMSVSDEIIQIRNKIVHDKPYDYYENDGNVEITSFSNTESNDSVTYRYDDLKEFFIKCDKVKNYIISDTILETLEIGDFEALLK